MAAVLAACSGGIGEASPEQIRLNDEPVASLADLDAALPFRVVLPAVDGFRLGVVSATTPPSAMPGAMRTGSELQAFYRTSSETSEGFVAVLRAEPPNRDDSYEPEQALDVAGVSAQAYLTPDGARTLAFTACDTAIDLRAGDAAAWPPERLAEVGSAFVECCRG